ncbi:MAG: hypothetical protein C0501_14375, partial [Isosphaera sp.]|nr:hypothetical protein [Isosphaera sp.]
GITILQDLAQYGRFAKVPKDRVSQEVMEFRIQRHAKTFLAQSLSPDELTELCVRLDDYDFAVPCYEKEKKALICEVRRLFLALLKT